MERSMSGIGSTRRGFGAALSSALLFVSLSVQSAPIDIYEFSVFVNATELGASSVGETQIANGFTGLSEFSGIGLGFSHQNNLASDNTGTLSWSITNNTGTDLSNTRLFGFLDASIDEPANTYFNETGDASGFSVGSGSADSIADSWEIDEPGYLFGDIYKNIGAGALDNSNGITAPDDVSMALGFQIDELLMGEVLTLVFDISTIDNGGLFHSDPDSRFGFYFNGEVHKATVPEPSTLIMLAFGLLTLVGQGVGRSS